MPIFAAKSRGWLHQRAPHSRLAGRGAVGAMRRLVPAIAVLLLLGACEPQDQRPGLWLRGSLQPYPEDWSFTREHREIAIEVQAPYFLPHSVTILCATFDGDLYVSAFRPETKNWTAWVGNDPNVVLKIGDNLYKGRLSRVDDPLTIIDVLGAYSSKYRVAGREPTALRFWRVDPRA